MKKLEIYQGSDKKIILLEYPSINSMYEKNRLEDKEVCEFLKNLSRKNITNIYESKDKENLTLEYDDFIININEYQSILINKNLIPLLRTIKDYSKVKDEELDDKVTRKNKHIGKRIVAAVLVTVVLYAISKNRKSDVPVVEETSLSETIDYESETTTENIVDAENPPEETNIEITENLSEETTNDLELKYIKKEETTEISDDYLDEAESIILEYEDRSNSDKAVITQQKYGDLIKKYSTIYGIDPIIVTAIATQERGIHSSEIDGGGAIGLMQLQVNVWNDEQISAHNFETGQEDTEHITLDKLKDIEYNIKIGCMYFQNCSEDMNYNLLAAIQCYNMGYGNMMDILSSCSFENNVSIRNILNSCYDNKWLDYRSEVNQGDSNYIENVLSWIGNKVNVFIKQMDGQTNVYRIENVQNEKTR